MRVLYSVFLLFFCSLASIASEPLRKTKIKAVVFDFNGVIVKSDRQLVIDFIAASLDIPSDEAQQALAQTKKLRLSQEKDEKDFWSGMANSREKNLPDHWLEQYHQAKFSAIRTVPGMVDIVHNLQNQGFQTALLTNTKKSSAIIKEKLGLYDLFQPIIFAYKVGVEKPNPKIYQILLDQLNMLPEEVVFIDNKAVNIAAARQLGMDAIEFHNADQLIEALKRSGIKIQ